MNTTRLFLFPTEWSATLVLFFFALRRMANCQNLWEVLILLGLFLSIFFMVCLASLTYARMGTHVRDWAKLIAVLATPVRRACIASKNEKKREKSHGPRSK